MGDFSDALIHRSGYDGEGFAGGRFETEPLFGSDTAPRVMLSAPPPVGAGEAVR